MIEENLVVACSSGIIWGTYQYHRCKYVKKVRSICVAAPAFAFLRMHFRLFSLMLLIGRSSLLIREAHLLACSCPHAFPVIRMHSYLISGCRIHDQFLNSLYEFAVLRISSLPRLFSVTCGFRFSMATVKVLEDEFLERISEEEASFAEGTDRLNEDQLESVRLCCELFRADVVESLKEVSVSQQYRLLRVRKLLRQIYSDLERPTIFLLCMLPWPITNLTKLDQRKFLPKLRTWCEDIPEKEGLQKNSEDCL